MKRKTMPYSIQNGQRVFMLPAATPKNREDLNIQLGYEEEHSWPVAFIAVAAAVFVALLTCAILAGLTYPQWKHLLK